MFFAVYKLAEWRKSSNFTTDFYVKTIEENETST